jgi:predicted lactoylglutathione lyase
MRAENDTGPQINTNSSVESMVDKALSNGAKPSNPQEDLGWMYGRGFQDLDGATCGRFLHGHQCHAKVVRTKI